MNVNKNDYIITNLSFFPSFIVEKNNSDYLITIKEYNGDYMWVNQTQIIGKISIPIEEKLSILFNYYDGFYLLHKDRINELIIEGLITLMYT